MAGSRKLVIEILGNARDAAKAFADVRSDSAKTEERLDRFGTSALGAGVAIAAGLAYAVTQFVEADVAAQKLNNSAKNSAASAKINASALRDVAQATQSKTAADGDALVAGQAMLVQFGATQEQTVALTPLIADLSRKMGVDTESAARAVGKALNGSTTSLQKMGIQVDATKAATDPFTATMDALRGSVGGFAESEGATAAGTLERIKNQLGDVVEAVGGGALEAFAPLVDAVSGLVSAGGPAGDALGNIAGKLGVIGSTTLLAMGGLIKAREGIDKIRESAVGAAGGLGKMGTAIGLLGAVGAGIALVGIVQSINEATRSTLEFENAANDLKNATSSGELGAAIIAMGASMDGLGDRVYDTLGIMLNLRGQMSQTIDVGGTLIQFDTLGRTLKRLKDSGDTEALALTLAYVSENADGTESELKKLDGILAPYQESVAGAAKGTDGHAASLDNATTATMLANDALQEYSDSLRAQTDPVFAAIRATTQNADAKQKAADAEAKLSFLTKAGMTGSMEYAAAQRELSRANLDSTSSAVGQQSALATLAQKMRDGTISQATYNQTLDGFREKGLISAATATAMKNEFGGAAFGAGALSTELGKTKGKADTLNGTRATVTVTANTGDAQVKIDGFTTSLRNLSLLAQTTGVLAPGFKAKVDAAVGQPRRATGGSVFAGQPYLVGERGPELVMPGSGYVIPTRRLIDAPTGGGGGGGVVVNVTTGVGDPVAIGRQVVESLKAYERTTGTSWRS